MKLRTILYGYTFQNAGYIPNPSESNVVQSIYSEYIGGTIAPGLKISSDALFEKTAKLPKVELEEPGQVICRNTINSMQSGLVYGHMGLVEFIVRRMKKELAEYCAADGVKEEDIKVIATGGLATMIDQGVDCINYVDKLLTLEGLEMIYNKNKKCRKQVSQEEIDKDDMLYEGKL